MMPARGSRSALKVDTSTSSWTSHAPSARGVRLRARHEIRTLRAGAGSDCAGVVSVFGQHIRQLDPNPCVATSIEQLSLRLTIVCGPFRA